MLSKQSRTKLDLIRLEGICKMLLERIDHDTLKNKIESVLGIGEIKDVKHALFRLPRYQLIKIIETTPSISSKDINDAYEQYRYGLKPGFTLFCINGTCKKIGISELETGIKAFLSEIKDGDEDNYKGLKYKDKVKIDENVYEFCFTFLSKYSYISETEEPKFIYELEECFVWISTVDMFIAIKNAPNKVTNILKRIFTTLFNTHVSNIKLTKKLIDEIFGDNKMRKGTFYKPTAGKDEAQKVTVADPDLSEKTVIREQFQGYDITSSHLNEEIDENTTSTLGINCNKGKLYITHNVSASVFRNWSVKRIKDIVSYLKQTDNSKDFDIFKAKNIMSDSIWTSYNTKQKDILENILFALLAFKFNKAVSFQLNYSTEYIFHNLFELFYNRISFDCEFCNDTCIAFCSKCGSCNLYLVKNGMLICSKCGNTQKDNYILLCEEGHDNSFDNINDFTILIPTGNLLMKINETLRSYFEIEINLPSESFYIRDNTINFLASPKGEYISPDNILELKDVANRKLTEEKHKNLLSEFDTIKEKCRSMSNKNCNSCLLSDKSICIMKIFTTYNGFRPNPHHGQEFGDISFEVTYKGQRLELVGIAKSRQKNRDVLNLSDDSARELLQQFLSMTHDKRVGIISAICPMRFHEQLVQELKYISRLTAAKMTIFDDIFMTRLLDYYNEREKLKKTKNIS